MQDTANYNENMLLEMQWEMEQICLRKILRD